ncbi:hypothetical protein HDU67_004831 [Dinochytrium kinnereticum]|nr:hypothetical protein HDU67_004831 [Dinochytrium kinnereticum]
MTQGLIGVFKRHMHMLHGENSPFDPIEIFSAKSLTEFDDAVTRRAFGFRTVHEYYRMGSSAQYVPDIRIPTLILSALDDPIASYKTIPVYETKANPNVILATTLRGGHIGWYQGIIPTRWFQEPVVDFITAMFEAYHGLPAEHRSKFLQAAKGALPITHLDKSQSTTKHEKPLPTSRHDKATKTDEIDEKTSVADSKEETALTQFASTESKVKWLRKIVSILGKGTETDGDPHARILRRAATVCFSIAFGYWAGRQRLSRARR